METIWRAWRTLHFWEGLLLIGALAVLSFCAGANWQIAHSKSHAPPLFQEAPQAQAVHWNQQGSVTVDVAGAVRHPGVLRMPQGARVQDAVQKAGGVLPGANASAVNLAAELQDGQQVLIPGKSGAASPVNINAFPANSPAVESIPGETKGKKGTKSPSQPVNINQANAVELQSVPGVGPVMAQRIIQYRSSHGAFQSPDDLDAVQGIGAKKLEKMKPWIVFH